MQLSGNYLPTTLAVKEPKIPKVSQREIAEFVREHKRELARVAATMTDGGADAFARRICSQSPYDDYALKMLNQRASPVSRSQWNAVLSRLRRGHGSDPAARRER